MSVISALKHEEKKWLRQADEARQQLATIYAAMKLMGKRGKAGGTGRKRRRKMSAATRAKMKASAKARWAKAKKE
jgi:hypothetical protein